MSKNAIQFQGVLKQLGFHCPIVEFSESTRTAADAALAIGCTVSQIAKSLVFRGRTTGKPLLIIASGSNRVNESRIADIVGEKIEKATADFVREHTGYAIGGVPPLGHPIPLTTLIDQDLFEFPEIWAAAGTPRSVFKLNQADLIQLEQCTNATRFTTDLSLAT